MTSKFLPVGVLNDVATDLGISTFLFPHFATHLIGLWGFALGAFPACASTWMFVVAPKDVERGMPLFVAMFQVIIALVGCGFVTMLVLGRKVSNRLAAQAC